MLLRAASARNARRRGLARVFTACQRRATAQFDRRRTSCPQRLEQPVELGDLVAERPPTLNEGVSRGAQPNPFQTGCSCQQTLVPATECAPEAARRVESYTCGPPGVPIADRSLGPEMTSPPGALPMPRLAPVGDVGRSSMK